MSELAKTTPSPGAPQCCKCKWWEEMPYEHAMHCDFIGTTHNNPQIDGCNIIYRTLDDQGLDFWLKTGPNFGCINFAPREHSNNEH